MSFPEGVILKNLKENIDERGFFVELFRSDWKDVIKEPIVQSNFSLSFPRVVRAWHRHVRGQVDYFVCLDGQIEVMIKENESGPITKILLNGFMTPKILRVPGEYWHGYRVVGERPAKVLYFVTQLYNYKNPDEERQEYVK